MLQSRHSIAGEANSARPQPFAEDSCPSHLSGSNSNALRTSSPKSSNVDASNARNIALEAQEGGKRNRYQYSCIQCQRRKQRCSRTFPCEKCKQRGIANLCSPPSNLHRPSRRIRMRQKLAQASSSKDDDKEEAQQDPDDMDTYELDDEHDATSSHPSLDAVGIPGGAVLQHSQSFSHMNSSYYASNSFSQQGKPHEPSHHTQHLIQTSRLQQPSYRAQQHQQPPSPHQYSSTEVYQSRRSQSLYQTHSYTDSFPFTSASGIPRSMQAERAPLTSPTRVQPHLRSPSDLSSSSMHEPIPHHIDTLPTASASTRAGFADGSSEYTGTGADALAQLATVAQWPALQQQQEQHQQQQQEADSAHAGLENQAETSPLCPISGAASRPPMTGAVLDAPSSSRSQQSAPGLDSDERSMVDADDAFIGKPALNGLGWNPFRRHEGMGTDLLSWTGQLGRGFGLVIPKYELRSVQQSLPTKSEAHRLLQIYLDDFNWSRFPSSPSELVKSVDCCVEQCPISDDVQMLPLMAFCLSIFGLATLDLAVRPYPTRSSRTYFFAARKALSLSESLGLHTLDSLSASLNLCRYLDLCRVPRSTWLQVASCMRGAIDLGLHLNGAQLGQDCSATLQRRILWSHIIHQDREWSVLFGRPMTDIAYSTTPTPTLQDYLRNGLELACAQYLVVRDAFRVHIERISRLFQEIAASANSSPTSRIYERALEIDRDIVVFTESLPPCLSASSRPSGGAMGYQDFSATFYHHLCTNQILFFRSLLHRPFWMESSDLASADRYKHSRQICVDLALTDLRGRRLLSRRIPVTMLCHLYGSAYSLLSMNTIIASDILFALEYGEMLQSEEVQEKLGYIQEYVGTVRANIQESRGDHLAVKELYVMRSLLKRIQDKVGALNPQSVGFQVLGVRYPGGCADRLAMTLTELQSAANLLLNMARAGVRIDDATRVPSGGEDRLSASTRSNTASGPSSATAGSGAAAGQFHPQSQAYLGAGAYASSPAHGESSAAMMEGSTGDAAGILHPGSGDIVTPSADSLDAFLSNADEWLSSLLNPGAAASSAPNQPLDFGFSLF